MNKNTADRQTIRCWTTRWVVITVVAVVTAGGIQGYAVEARAWGGAVAAAILVTEQQVAMRLARTAARATSRPGALLALAGGAR